MRAVSVECGSEARPELCLPWKTEGKGLPVRMAKTASGAQVASRITVPWGSLVVSWARVWATWYECEVSLALNRSCWWPSEIPSNLYHSTGCHLNWLTLMRGSSWSNKQCFVVFCWMRKTTVVRLLQVRFRFFFWWTVTSQMKMPFMF